MLPYAATQCTEAAHRFMSLHLCCLLHNLVVLLSRMLRCCTYLRRPCWRLCLQAGRCTLMQHRMSSSSTYQLGSRPTSTHLTSTTGSSTSRTRRNSSSCDTLCLLQSMAVAALCSWFWLSRAPVPATVVFKIAAGRSRGLALLCAATCLKYMQFRSAVKFIA